MNVPIDLMISIIKESEECRQYLTVTYPHEYEIWHRFSTRNGAHCPFSRAALRRIFQNELGRSKEDFIHSLGGKTWGSKKYQEHSGEQLDTSSGDKE